MLSIHSRFLIECSLVIFHGSMEFWMVIWSHGSALLHMTTYIVAPVESCACFAALWNLSINERLRMFGLGEFAKSCRFCFLHGGNRFTHTNWHVSLLWLSFVRSCCTLDKLVWNRCLHEIDAIVIRRGKIYLSYLLRIKILRIRHYHFFKVRVHSLGFVFGWGLRYAGRGSDKILDVFAAAADTLRGMV